MHPPDFPAAYTRFWGPIQAKCRRLLGATAAADDVAQEAFLRLWQSGPALDGSTEARQVLAWLYLTSTRLSLDVLRTPTTLVLDADGRIWSRASGQPRKEQVLAALPL